MNVDSCIAARRLARSNLRDQLLLMDTQALSKRWHALCRDGRAEPSDDMYPTHTKLVRLITYAELPDLEDSTVKTTASVHPLPTSGTVDDSNRDRFIRTGIILDEDGGASLDVLRSDGTFLLRINLASNDDGWANVDVLLDKSQVPTLLGWNNYTEIARQELPAGSLVAINVEKEKGETL